MSDSQATEFRTTDTRPSHRRFSVIAGLGLLALLALAYAVKIIGSAPDASQGSGAMLDGPPPAAVFVEAPVQVVTQNTVTVTGSLRAVARAAVAAREAGAVLEILVDEGDAVEDGAALAKLDARRAMALLEEAGSSQTAAASLVRQRAAELARARDDLNMKRGLLQRKAVSRSDILDAEQALAVAQAQHDAAVDRVAETQSRVEFLEVQLEDMIIRAPFAGIIVERHVELGEWVAAGSVIATLLKVDPVEAWLRVPARYRLDTEDYSTENGDSGETSEQLRVRQSATGKLFTPSKVTLVPDVDPLSQLFTVVASIDNSELQLTPGESITGLVPVGRPAPHWQISVDALIRTPAGDFVFADDGEGAAVRLPVTVAFEREGHAFIPLSNESLRDGSRLVVEGNERLRPGQKLIIRPRDATAAGS